jgi:hypothetical protein
MLEQVIKLIQLGQVVISDHGYDELAADGLLVSDIVPRVNDARLIEQYLDYAKGPCILVLQKDRNGEPVHAVWGIPKGKTSPVALVTAYRPDPARWENDFIRRKK